MSNDWRQRDLQSRARHSRDEAESAASYATFYRREVEKLKEKLVAVEETARFRGQRDD